MAGKGGRLTKFLKSIMLSTGTWRLIISDDKFIQISYNFYSVFCQLSLLCFFLGLLFNLPVLLRKRDYQIIVENVGYLTITLVMIVKLIICQTSKIQRLIVQCIFEEKRTYLVEPQQFKDNFDVHIKHLNGVYIILIPVTTIVLVLFFGANYLDFAVYKDFNSTVDKPLILPIWYPFDANNHYTAAFLIGLWLTFMGTIYNVVTQALFLTLTTYAILQLKALQIYGRYFHLFCVEPIRLGSSGYNEDKILKIFRNICIKHLDIIRYFIIPGTTNVRFSAPGETVSFVEDFNLAMKNVLFLEYLLNSLNIAAVMIQILVMSNPPVMLSFCFSILTYQVLTLFWMCWHANEIQLQSEALSEALFLSKWWKKSGKVKRIISIMMMRSRKPLVILIGPFFPMSIHTGIATMKAAYSYVTLIFTLAANE